MRRIILVLRGVDQPQKGTEKSAQNIKTIKAQSSAQTVKTSPSLPPVPRSAVSLAMAAGLPADKLSASIVSFARFFSLPLKPQLLADIRRQAFTPQLTQPAQAQTTQTQAAQTQNIQSQNAQETIRSALSLAAAAAESKGVELQPKGLDLYAEAINPDSQRRQDKEQQQKKQNREQEEKEITAEGIKKMAFKSEEDNPLLNILNKLPSKNGQRWVVLPFDFSQDGKDFRVSMRILLDDKQVSNMAACMALDISVNEISINMEQKWLFVLESSGENPVRLSVFSQSELPQKTQLKYKNELSKLLGISPERIFIKSSNEQFPFEAGEPLAAVDEAV